MQKIEKKLTVTILILNPGTAEKPIFGHEVGLGHVIYSDWLFLKFWRQKEKNIGSFLFASRSFKSVVMCLVYVS